MALKHGEDSCTAILDDDQSDLTSCKSRQPKTINGAKDFKKFRSTNLDACDPDIIPPAARSLEEDINSEFYPVIYIPQKGD
jgi:hypothetical protein